MTTLGKLFVLSQFVLSVAFAIIAGMFFVHRMPWDTPAPSAGGTPTPGLVEQHQKKLQLLIEPHDRAQARWNKNFSDLQFLQQLLQIRRFVLHGALRVRCRRERDQSLSHRCLRARAEIGDGR